MLGELVIGCHDQCLKDAGHSLTANTLVLDLESAVGHLFIIPDQPSRKG